jgi:hypothetical protein
MKAIVSQSVSGTSYSLHHRSGHFHPPGTGFPSHPIALTNDTPVIDDAVFRTYGGPLKLVGRWWGSQHKRVVHGIDGVLWLIIVGDGYLVVPIDFAGRRPNPQGPRLLLAPRILIPYTAVS